jgi:uncharacterized protein YbjT (DUF2867 family)
MPNAGDVILVTGATGKQGGHVARELLAKGQRVRAMTRHTDSAAAKELAELGAQVVFGDYDNPASLPKALEGAWGTYAVQKTWEAGVEREEVQGKVFADAAKKAGVQHYVYSSVGSAQHNTGIPHFDNKWRIEERVRALGFPSWTILRPVFFMENLLSADNTSAIAAGTFPLGIRPTTPLQLLALDDLGKYGLLALEQPERFNGKAIDIASDSVTPTQIAEVLTKVTGHPVKHFQVPIAEVRKFSEDLALMLEWFDTVGYSADIPGNAKEYAVKPTSFETWARQHVAD